MVALAAVLVGLTGCTGPGAAGEWPEGSWRGVGATCPTLDSETGARMALTGEGQPGPLTDDRGSINRIDCTWGDPDGQLPSLHAQVTVYRVQKAADAHYSGVSFDVNLVPDLGDQANLLVVPPSVKVYVRSRNAVAVIDYKHPTDNAEPDDRQRTEAVAFAADILDDLRTDR